MRIRTKLILIVSLGFGAVFATVLALEFRASKQIGVFIEARNDEKTAELLAGQLAQPLRFHDAGRIEKLVDVATQGDRTILRVIVEHADGNTIFDTAVGGEARADTDPSNAGLAPRRDGGSIAIARAGSLFFAAVPVTLGAEGARVGTLTMVWDHGVVIGEIVSELAFNLLVGGAIAVAGLILIGLMIERLVVRPMKALDQAMEAVARREFETVIPGTSRADELGAMAQSLDRFRDALMREATTALRTENETRQRQAMYARLSEGLAELSGGNVECAIDLAAFEALDQEQEVVLTNFNDLLVNLRDMLATVTATAESVRNGSAEISQVASEQSKRSEIQAATLEESAAAIDELNRGVQASAGHAASAAEEIVQNRRKAETGGEIVGRTVEAMGKIEESSQQINAITGVIEDIAFQTNLLALNAGVEAARAGEAGRGFAVVASEVRALAQRASESANEIKELILMSSSHVAAGSALAGEAGEALAEIIAGIANVSDLVTRIATGAREQAQNLSEIKDGVVELDKVTQQNAAVIEETSAASRTLSQEASRMTEVLGRFRFEAELGLDASHPLSVPKGQGDWGSRSGELTGSSGLARAVPFVSRVSLSGGAAAQEGWDDF